MVDCSDYGDFSVCTELCEFGAIVLIMLIRCTGLALSIVTVSSRGL